MPAPREQALLTRAATLYYIAGKSQSEVAAELGVSRSNVSRMLAAARRLGIVDIRIRDPFSRAAELEGRLISAFGLAECYVAPSEGQQSTITRIGELGARWLLDHLPQRGSIALSWGTSVQSVVEAMPDEPTHQQLEILPLVGGLSMVGAARDGNMLVHSLAGKLGASPRRLDAPAVVQSRETREALLAEPAISNVLNAASEAEVALVGIGVVGSGASSAIIDAMNLTPDEKREFRRSNAVGDCCTRFFDADGNPVSSPADDRVVSIDLEGLRAIPTVVAVAAGANKAAGVRGALRNGMLNVLIVDAGLAQALLNTGD